MHSRFILVATILSFSIISGCSTTSEADYNAGITVVKSNPSARKEISRKCIAEVKAQSLLDQKNLAAVMNVSLASYPKVFCQRLIGAMLNGRLTHADFKAMSGLNGDYSKLIKIVQGR